ncbi:hypothetical protein D3C73_1302080 [compost metagenome]
MTSVIAFSKASLVMISRGYSSFFSSSTTALPASTHSADLSAAIAEVEEEPGRLMPSASAAEAIVLAVYIPPQEPAPGQTWHSIWCSSSSLIFPS